MNPDNLWHHEIYGKISWNKKKKTFPLFWTILASGLFNRHLWTISLITIYYNCSLAVHCLIVISYCSRWLNNKTLKLFWEAIIHLLSLIELTKACYQHDVWSWWGAIWDEECFISTIALLEFENLIKLTIFCKKEKPHIQ